MPRETTVNVFGQQQDNSSAFSYGTSNADNLLTPDLSHLSKSTTSPNLSFSDGRLGENHTNFAEIHIASMIYKVYTPLCASLGITGNCLTLLVLLWGKMSRSTAYTYMTAIAGCDLIDQILSIGFYLETYLKELTLRRERICGIILFLFYFAIHCSVMLTVTMTMERYLVIKYPLKAKSFFTIKRARLSVGTMAILSASLNFHNFFTRGTEWNDQLRKNVCVPANKTSAYFLYQIWPWIDGSVYCYIPFPTLAVLNFLIVRELRRPKQPLAEISEPQAKLYIRRQDSRQITLMLLLVTVTFLVLVVPIGIILVTENEIEKKASPHGLAVFNLVRTIVDSLTYTHHAINFVLYCLSGGKFRREVLRMICRIRPRHNLRAATPYSISAITLPNPQLNMISKL